MYCDIFYIVSQLPLSTCVVSSQFLDGVGFLSINWINWFLNKRNLFTFFFLCVCVWVFFCLPYTAVTLINLFHSWEFWLQNFICCLFQSLLVQPGWASIAGWCITGRLLLFKSYNQGLKHAQYSQILKC